MIPGSQCSKHLERSMLEKKNTSMFTKHLF